MKENSTYSLHKLMEIVDISVVPAMQAVSTRAGFFALMDTLVALSHEVIDEYSAARLDEDARRRYMAKLGAFQKRLLDINATRAVWAIEQFTAALEGGDGRKAQQQFQNLSRVLHPLVTKIEHAKLALTPATGAAAEEPRVRQPAPDVPTARVRSVDGRPAAPAKPELFERILTLVRNFEAAPAIEQLRVLESVTFSVETDETLLAVHADLMRFAYAEAGEKLEGLLRSLYGAQGAPGGAGRKKILAVDDQPVVLSALQAMLGEHYTVICVTGHMAALQYLTNNSVDLVLLDIEMPDMDGFTLLGIIRKMERYKDVPIVFLTGRASAQDVREARALGGNDFVRKPVDAETLHAKLEKYLI